MDCSVRIWDLKINQPVGQPLLHDNELLVVAVSPDGQYIVRTVLDAKIYVWSLEAVLKQDSDQAGSAHDWNANTYKRLQVPATPPMPKQLSHTHL